VQQKLISQGLSGSKKALMHQHRVSCACSGGMSRRR